MPVLPNPRHEAFAQAIVAGLASDRPHGKNTAKAAYLSVGYAPTTDNAARAAASRTDQYNPSDLSNAKDSDSLGRGLLEAVGCIPPFTDQEIKDAIAKPFSKASLAIAQMARTLQKRPIRSWLHAKLREIFLAYRFVEELEAIRDARGG